MSPLMNPEETEESPYEEPMFCPTCGHELEPVIVETKAGNELHLWKCECEEIEGATEL
jgi:hypothetical protein